MRATLRHSYSLTTWFVHHYSFMPLPLFQNYARCSCIPIMPEIMPAYCAQACLSYNYYLLLPHSLSLHPLSLSLHSPLSLTQYKYDPASADWSREMRGKGLVSSVHLQDYMILFTGRDAPKAQVCVWTIHWTALPCTSTCTCTVGVKKMFLFPVR